MERYVYIKLSIAGHFVEFAEPLKAEEYNNLGSTYEDYLNNKWVLLSDEQVAFHEEHPTASVAEVWNMEITPVPPRTLEQAKSEKLMQINSYDNSSEVNGFTINGEIEGWLTPSERSNYRSSIEAAKKFSVPELSFYVGDFLMTVTPEQGDYMLDQVQLYADACAIVTKQHQLEVNALTTIEEVDAFDYTAGYPQKLDFTYPIEVS